MKLTNCEKCGSSKFEYHVTVAICVYCRTAYTLPTRNNPTAADLSMAQGVQALLARADSLWSLGEKSKAKKLYAQVLELDARNTHAYERYIEKQHLNY